MNGLLNSVSFFLCLDNFFFNYSVVISPQVLFMYVLLVLPELSVDGRLHLKLGLK